MSTKLIITERQYKLLTLLNENMMHEQLVEMLVNDLNMNYEPMIGVMRENGEYRDEPMIKIKADDTEISPKELYEYFKKKYKLGNDFTKQVISDWMFGTLDGNRLSKNVSLS